MPAVEEKQYLTVQSDYRKIQVPVEEVAYLTIEGRKTKITQRDGSTLCTNRSLRDVFGDLPGEAFVSVNRGIVVAKALIREESAGVITMEDGTRFKRRIRTGRSQGSKTPSGQSKELPPCPAETLEQWLGRLPMPVCIMELVYRKWGGGAEFVVRYCNRAMEQLEQAEGLREQPLTALKGLGNPKWLTAFADVAINGTPRTLEELWENGGKYLRLQCYQPREGCCAVVLTDLTRENSLIQELFQRGK